MAMLFLLVSICLSILQCSALSVAAGEAQAAMGVLSRLTPFYKRFTLELTQGTLSQAAGTMPGESKDTFSVIAANNSVLVKGSSGVALTAGAYHYIKTQLGGQVTWGENGSGNQVNLPNIWPDYVSGVITANAAFHYAWNMCTFSYTATWWDEARWRREIDWFALHGVNLPLAVTAQEYVWMKVFEDYNVPLEALQTWFVGPAYMTWQRMGNIRGVAGPLSRAWIEQQKDMNLFILSEMRALGMRPVLSCFAGHVPKVFTSIFPNASVSHSTGWNGFSPQQTDVYFLDPVDPAFQVIGSKFMQVQAEVFGMSSYYACDTFNEVNPTNTSIPYLKQAGSAVINAIRSVDPNGVWVMQGWLFKFSFWSFDFVQSYLSGIPIGQLLILDLESLSDLLAPKFNYYFGHRWVWNMLHNFGGVRGMYGDLDGVASGPYEQLLVSGGTMVGIGFTPEAIEQNPVMYELLTDTFFLPGPINVSTWLTAYVSQRYGGSNALMQKAWQSLYQAVYNQNGEPRSELEWTPHWWNNEYGWVNGNPDGMYVAFQQMVAAVEADSTLLDISPFQYDLVDIARQTTTMLFSDVHRQFSNAMFLNQYGQASPNSKSPQRVGTYLLSLIQALDTLLATNPNYLLGMWTGRAAQWAARVGNNSAAQYDYNAKNIITLWNLEPEGNLIDYACKAWAGLYGDYYFGRWNLLVTMSVSAAATSQPFDYNGYQQQLDTFETSWVNGAKAYPMQPSGGSVNDVLQTIATLINGAPHLQNYTVMQSTAFQGASAEEQMWTQDPARLALLCDLMDECVGFWGSTMYLTGSTTFSSFGNTVYKKTAGAN